MNVLVIRYGKIQIDNNSIKNPKTTSNINNKEKKNPDFIS